MFEALKAGVREFARVKGLQLQARRIQQVKAYKESHNADGTRKLPPAPRKGSKSAE